MAVDQYGLELETNEPTELVQPKIEMTPQVEQTSDEFGLNLDKQEQDPQIATPVLTPTPEDDLNDSYLRTIDIQPDKAVNVLNISKKLDLDPAYVNETYETATKYAETPTYQDWKNLNDQAPVTAKYLSNPKKMAIAKDDIKQLSKLESIFMSLVVGTYTGLQNIRRSELGMTQMLNSLVSGKRDLSGEDELQKLDKELTVLNALGPKEGEISPESVFYHTGTQLPNFAYMGLNAAKRGLQFGLIGAGAGSLAGGVGSAPGAIAGSQFGVVAGGIEAVANLEGGNSYREFSTLKDKNGNYIDPRLAATGALAVGVINAGLETFSMTKFLKVIPGGEQVIDFISKNKKVFENLTPGRAVSQAVKNLLIATSTEVGTEVVQEGVNVGGEIITKKVSGLDFEETDYKKAVDRITDVINPTIQSTLLLGGIGSVINLSTAYDRAKVAEANKVYYEQILKESEKSKLLERSPEEFKNLVEEQTKNTPVENIYIPVDRFEIYFQENNIPIDNVLNELGISKQEFNDVKNISGNVKIPLATWVTSSAKTEHGVKLNQDITFSEDIPTPRQAQAEIEFASQDIEEQIKQAEQTQASTELKKEDYDLVYNYMYDYQEKLGIKSKVERDANAKVWVARAKTESRKRGITVSEWFQGITKPVTKEEFSVATSPLYQDQEEQQVEPFYSKLQKIISDKMPKKAPSSVIAVFDDRGMVKSGLLSEIKPEEISYTKVREFLKDKDVVEKQEFLDFIEENKLKLTEYRRSQKLKSEKTEKKNGLDYFTNLERNEINIDDDISREKDNYLDNGDWVTERRELLLENNREYYENEDGTINEERLRGAINDDAYELARDDVQSEDYHYAIWETEFDPGDDLETGITIIISGNNEVDWYVNSSKRNILNDKSFSTLEEAQAHILSSLIENKYINEDQFKDVSVPIDLNTQQWSDIKNNNYPRIGNWTFSKPSNIDNENLKEQFNKFKTKLPKEIKSKLLEEAKKEEVDSIANGSVYGDVSKGSKRRIDENYNRLIGGLFIQHLNDPNIKENILSSSIGNSFHKAIIIGNNVIGWRIKIDGIFGEETLDARAVNIDQAKSLAIDELLGRGLIQGNGIRLEPFNTTSGVIPGSDFINKGETRWHKSPDYVLPGNKKGYGEVVFTAHSGIPMMKPFRYTTHFPEENLLYHYRYDEREIIKKDNTKEKTFFVEEIQSDVHQQAREYGYIGDLAKNELEVTTSVVDGKPVRERFYITTDMVEEEFYSEEKGRYKGTQAVWAIENKKTGEKIPTKIPASEDFYGDSTVNFTQFTKFIRNQFGKEGLERLHLGWSDNLVPPLPLRKNWTENALKRIVDHAIREGYESVSWTTGAQQSKRWNQQLKGINLRYKKEGDKYRLIAVKEGEEKLNELIDEQNLHLYVGKETASKIIDGYESKLTVQENIIDKMSEHFYEDGDDIYVRNNEGKRVSNFKIGGNEKEDFAIVYNKIIIEESKTKESLYENLLNYSLLARDNKIFINKNKYDNTFYIEINGEQTDDFKSSKEALDFAIEKTKHQGEGFKTISEGDFTLSSHGFVVSYDIMLKNTAESIFKKYKQKVEDAEIITDPIKQEKETVRTIKITPEMRKDILEKGQTLFQNDPKQPKAQVSIDIKNNVSVIELFKKRDQSSFIHESAHIWLADIKNYLDQGGDSSEVINDYRKLEEWLGLQTDQELTPEAQEKFARGFEAYLREGVAPSQFLQRVFHSFKKWLTNIYKQIKGTPIDVGLSDDIRGVFDRMLATEQEIEIAKGRVEIRNQIPQELLKNMPAKLIAQLNDLDLIAREEAEAKLLKPQIEELTEEKKKEYAEKLNQTVDRVREEVARVKIYKTIEYLRLAFNKRREKELAGRYVANSLPELDRYKFDSFAESEGYSSGSELAQLIMKAPSYADEVRNRVAIEMIQYSNLKDSVKIKEEAVKSLHSDRQLELMALEREILVKIAEEKTVRENIKDTERAKARVKTIREREVNKQKLKVDSEFIKSTARDILSRKTIKQASNYKTFFNAERNSAIKVAKAIKDKDYDKAAKFKREQMVNHALAISAIKISRKVESSKRYMKKIQSKDMKSFNDQAHFWQASELLRRFGFYRDDYNQSLKTETLQDWANRMDETNLSLDQQAQKEGVDAPYKAMSVDVADWLKEENVEMAFNDLTFDQMTDVVSAIKNIIHVANYEDKMLSIIKGKSVTDHVNELIEYADNNVTEADKYRDSQEAKRLSLFDNRFINISNKYTTKLESQSDQLKRNAARYTFSLKKVQTIFYYLDKWTEGKFTKLWEAVYKAANKESELLLVVDKLIKGAFSKYSKEELSDMVNVKIYDERLGMNMTKMRYLVMALQLGNKGNREKLFNNRIIGTNSLVWDEQFVMSVIQDHLDERDWKLVQDLWDTVNSVWPEASRVETETKGFTPQKVEADPIKVYVKNKKNPMAPPKEINLKGGYYPLRQDPRSSIVAEIRQNADDPLYAQKKYPGMATTKQGSLKERTNAQYPISLDINILGNHLHDVIHDIAYRAVVIDLRRIFANKNFQAMLRRNLGPEGHQILQTWLQMVGSANSTQKAGRTIFDSIASYLRTRTSAGVILLKVGTIIQNLANPFLYGGNIEGFNHNDALRAFLVRGVFDLLPKAVFTKEGRNIKQFVYSKSSFVRDRAKNPDLSLVEALRELFGDKNELIEFSVGLLSGSDELSIIPMWLEAYNMQLEKGVSDQDAVMYADKLIDRAVGSGRKQDVASITRGTELEKLFAMFYSFMNTETNRWMKEYNIVSKDIKNVPRFVGFLASRMMFVMLSTLLTGKGIGDDDDEEKINTFIAEFLKYPFALFPVIRDIAPVIIDRSLGLNSFGYRASPATAPIDSFANISTDLVRYFKDPESVETEKIAESVVRLNSMIGPFPYPDQINIWAFNTYDMVANDMDFRIEDIFKRRKKSER